MKKPSSKQWVGPMCAARFSGVGIPTLYRWIRRGKIPTKVVNVPRIKVRLGDIQAHIESDPTYVWRRKAGERAISVMRAKKEAKSLRKLARSWTQNKEVGS